MRIRTMVLSSIASGVMIGSSITGLAFADGVGHSLRVVNDGNGSMKVCEQLNCVGRTWTLKAHGGISPKGVDIDAIRVYRDQELRSTSGNDYTVCTVSRATAFKNCKVSPQLYSGGLRTTRHFVIR